MSAAFVTAGVFAASASVAQAPDVADIEFSPTSGPPGTSISVAGTCLLSGVAGDQVLVGITRDPPTTGFETTKTLVPAADGSVNGTIDVPATAAPGPYLVSAQCMQGDQSFGGNHRTPFVVTAAPTPTTVPPIAPPAVPRDGVPTFTG